MHNVMKFSTSSLKSVIEQPFYLIFPFPMEVLFFKLNTVFVSKCILTYFSTLKTHALWLDSVAFFKCLSSAYLLLVANRLEQILLEERTEAYHLKKKKKLVKTQDRLTRALLSSLMYYFRQICNTLCFGPNSVKRKQHSFSPPAGSIRIDSKEGKCYNITLKINKGKSTCEKKI